MLVCNIHLLIFHWHVPKIPDNRSGTLISIHSLIKAWLDWSNQINQFRFKHYFVTTIPEQCSETLLWTIHIQSCFLNITFLPLGVVFSKPRFWIIYSRIFPAWPWEFKILALSLEQSACLSRICNFSYQLIWILSFHTMFE